MSQGDRILQSEECAVQQRDPEIHEWPRISINVSLEEKDPPPDSSKSLCFCIERETLGIKMGI